MATVQNSTREGRKERAQRVAEAIHSGEMEGLDVSASARADASEYVAGNADSEELVHRVRARYGLE